MSNDLIRSDPAQATYYEVSIEESLSIPVQVNQVRDPPLFGDQRFPNRHLELNLGSAERARKLHDALGEVLEEYDRHETSEGDESIRGQQSRVRIWKGHNPDGDDYQGDQTKWSRSPKKRHTSGKTIHTTTARRSG